MAKTDWKYNDLVTEQDMNELGEEINGLAADGAAVKESVDAATNAAAAETLVKRDANGRAQVSGPLAVGDIANKGYVDAAISGAAVPDASLTAKGKVQLSSATDSTSEALAATPAAVKAAYDRGSDGVVAAAGAQTRADDAYSRADQAFMQASNGKTAVAAAITGMGQAASGSDTFAQLASKIGDISKDATAGAGEVLSGKTFYQGGAKKTGTMPSRGAPVWTPGVSNQYLPDGHYSGGTILGDPDLIAANILNSANIFGVQGTAISGLRYATGTTGTTTTVTVNGLSFQPKVVIIRGGGIPVSTLQHDTKIYVDPTLMTNQMVGSYVSNNVESALLQNGTKNVFYGGGWTITDNGFSVDMFYANGVFQWVAIG